jgi:hypothetical protein
VVNAESLGHDAEPAAELPADEVMFGSAAVERAAEGPFDQAAAEAAEAAQAAEASVVAAAERVDP